MDLHGGVDFARTRSKSVLVTLRENGHPQLSNVMHHVGPAGVVRISITSSRVKYQNLVREPWAALQVHAQEPSAVSMSAAIFSGLVVEPYRLITVPSLPTRNLVKFHLILLPSRPDFCSRSHL